MDESIMMQVEQAIEAHMRPAVEKFCDQYKRGLITASELLVQTHMLGVVTANRVPSPCPECGWNYPVEQLIEAVREETVLDENPNHLCVPPPPQSMTLANLLALLAAERIN